MQWRDADGTESAPFAMPRLPLSLLACACLVAAAALGCGSDDGGADAPTVVEAGLAQRGPFPVGMTTVDLVDEARPDDASGGPRFLKTEIWYPAAESAREAARAPAIGWAPARLRPLERLLDAIGIDILGVEPDAVRDAAPAEGAFPLIVFSHGNTGTRYQSFSLTEHLASYGFVVASPDHIGNAIVSERADGSLVFYVDPYGRPALERRIGDMRFLIDEMYRLAAPASGSPLAGVVDLDRPVGISGHSFGGVTTISVAAVDPRIGAAMPLAASVLGFEDLARPLTVPSSHWIAAEDKTIGERGNGANLELWGASATPRIFGDFVDAGHFSFTDGCELLPGFFDSDGCASGTRFSDGSSFEFLPTDELFPTLNAHATAFFQWQLEGRDGRRALLRGNPDPAELRYATEGL